MFENPRRGRQARNFTTNVPKILDFKSSSEQIFFRKLSLGAPENPAEFSNFEFSYRVGFGAKTNSARKQHVISTAWHISISRDWLGSFGFLLTYRTYVGNCHGH